MLIHCIYGYLYRIAKSSGFKSSELESLQEGNTLCIGGKEIEVRSVFPVLIVFTKCIESYMGENLGASNQLLW